MDKLRVWILTAYDDIDGVTTSTILGVYDTRDKAKKTKHIYETEVEKGFEAYSINEWTVE